MSGKLKELPANAVARELAEVLRELYKVDQFKSQVLMGEKIVDRARASNRGMPPFRNNRWLSEPMSGKQELNSTELEAVLSYLEGRPDMARGIKHGNILAARRRGNSPTSIPKPDISVDIVGVGACNYDHIAPAPRSGKAKARLQLRSPDDVGNFEQVLSSEEELEAQLEALIDVSSSSRSASEISHSLGGSAFNAVMLLTDSRLGCRVGFVGVSGRVPAGVPIEGAHWEALASCGHNVEPTYLARVEDMTGGRCASTIKVVSDKEASRYMSVWPGANNELAGHLIDNYWEIVGYLSSAKVVHVSSVFDPQAPVLIGEILRDSIAENPALVVSVDPGDKWSSGARKGVRQILKCSSVLFANQKELMGLAHHYSGPATGTRDDEAAQALQVLSEMRTGAHEEPVVVTKGRATFTTFRLPGPDEDPSRAIVEGRGEMPPLPLSDIVDDTGAGDVFAAAYLAPYVSRVLQRGTGGVLGLRLAGTALQQMGLPPSTELFESAMDAARTLGSGENRPSR